MREVILLSVILTVLQIVDVSFAAVSPKSTRTTLLASKQSELANSGKYAPETLLTKATLKRTTRMTAVDSDEDGDVIAEIGRQRFAAADTDTGPSKVSSGQLGRLLGNFVREQLTRNAVRVAEFKAGLLSGLGDCSLTDGLFDARTAPLTTTYQATLKGAKRGAAAPSRTTKPFSNAALPVVGIHSDETDTEDGRPTARADDDGEEDDESYVTPPSSLKTKRPVFKKTKN